MRFVIVLEPETPLQVAIDCALTKSAVILGLSEMGRTMSSVPAEAMLCAVLSKPIVTATKASTLPNGSVMGATVASIVPPPGGKGPVSTKNCVGAGERVNAASKALPLKVVVAAGLDVAVNHAEARGTVEYTNSGTTAITTKSISRLEVFAAFPTADLEIIRCSHT